MTREEAIDCNKNLKMYMRLSDKNQPYKFLEENYIALDMAIKALEQESCEDAISRQAVLNEMEIRRANGDMITAGFIKVLPPVMPKPKTGHWIDSSNGWICSECNKDNTFDTNYCPNCGVRMVEPQKKEK